MQALIRKLNGNYSVVYAILFISLLYIFFLESRVDEGIFYAGDQALKSLEVKQIAAGYGFKYLHLTQPDWVCTLWRADPRPSSWISSIVQPQVFFIFGTEDPYTRPLSPR